MGTGTCPEGITLSRESALEFHRKRRVAAALGKPYPKIYEVPRLSDGRISFKRLARDLELATPLHLTVPHDRPRVKSVYTKCRFMRDEARTMPICPGIDVATPEEALFQICKGNSQLRQLLFAYELCGSFAICPETEDGFINGLAPLTTPQDILKYASEKSGNHDSPRYRILNRVIASLVAGAASPAEAKLCLAIVAPRSIGGQGLPKPELNTEIPVCDAATYLTQRRLIRPDELWKGRKLILEYMGSHHAEAIRMGDDASRDNALNAMGYRVIHVTKRQVQDPGLYRGLMELLRKELGMRKYIPSQQMIERQEALRAMLFGTQGNMW